MALKFTTPHCGMAMLTSSENVSEKLILPGVLEGMGFWAPLGTSGGFHCIHKLHEQMLKDPEKLKGTAVRGKWPLSWPEFR